MFDIGFSELLVIALVALLVLGPERLPRAARFAGLWVRRARAQWHSVKSEFERDLAAADLKRSLHDTQAAMREAQAALRAGADDVQRGIDTTRDALMHGPAPRPRQSADADAGQPAADAHAQSHHAQSHPESARHDPSAAPATPAPDRDDDAVAR